MLVRKSSWLTWCLVVGCFVLILACGSEKPASSNPTSGGGGVSTGSTAAATQAPVGPGKVGERIVSGNTALTVLQTTRTPQLSDFQKVKEGEAYVVAEVLIEAVGDKATYNPFYFKVKDSDGFEYSIEIMTGDQGLKSGELVAGDKARGMVAFKVKAETKGLVLSYQPIALGAGDPIRVGLDQ
jgi:hypothetical protein